MRDALCVDAGEIDGAGIARLEARLAGAHRKHGAAGDVQPGAGIGTERDDPEVDQSAAGPLPGRNDTIDRLIDPLSGHIDDRVRSKCNFMNGAAELHRAAGDPDAAIDVEANGIERQRRCSVDLQGRTGVEDELRAFGNLEAGTDIQVERTEPRIAQHVSIEIEVRNTFGCVVEFVEIGEVAASISGDFATMMLSGVQTALAT